MGYGKYSKHSGKLTAYTMAEIGKYFGACCMTVSRAVRKFEVCRKGMLE